jgi:choline-sulfatase
VDLFPTLCGLAGVTAPEDLTGVDLSPTLQQRRNPPQRPIFNDNLVPRWGTGTEYRMIRWQHYKYVYFRNAPPLFFNLANDPFEQKNLLLQSVSGLAEAALTYLEKIALDSMDFEAAERERTERDGRLQQEYALNHPVLEENLYMMPSGRLVRAEDALYHQHVVSENPTEFFGDWPDA